MTDWHGTFAIITPFTRALSDDYVRMEGAARWWDAAELNGLTPLGEPTMRQLPDGTELLDSDGNVLHTIDADDPAAWRVEGQVQ